MKHITFKSFLIAASVVTTLSSLAQTKKVVIEDFTGKWCGWCPYGALAIETLENKYPGKVIGLANHYGDNLANTHTNATVSGLNVQGYPCLTMNRHFWTTPPDTGLFVFPVANDYSLYDLSDYVDDALSKPAVCSVSIIDVSYNSTAKTVTATVSATFNTALNGLYRLNLILTEDSIISNDQKNYGNTLSGSPFKGMGDPIPNYYQNHVCRFMGGTAFGSFGSLPSSIAANSTHIKTYTFNVSTYNVKQLNLIGLVQEAGSSVKQKEILNAEYGRLTELLSVGVATTPKPTFEIGVYPNPVNTNTCNVLLTMEKQGFANVEVYNLLGEKVSTLFNDNMNIGVHKLVWNADVPNGLYFIRTTVNGEKSVSKVMVSH